MRERRSQPRLLDAELVMLSWLEGATRLKQLGNVEDVSRNGMGVIVQNDLPVGTSVTISYEEEEELTGVVRHHSEREEGYFLGIEFEDGNKDSILHFHPDLLVRPV
jgi:PilZ domain